MRFLQYAKTNLKQLDRIDDGTELIHHILTLFKDVKDRTHRHRLMWYLFQEADIYGPMFKQDVLQLKPLRPALASFSKEKPREGRRSLVARGCRVKENSIQKRRGFAFGFGGDI